MTKAQEDRLDLYWRKAIKAKANLTCEYCGVKFKEADLEAHHIFSRERFSTRWDINNGICLCKKHHYGDAKAPAPHSTDSLQCEYFEQWVIEKLGRNFYMALQFKSLQIAKYLDYKLIRDQLNEIIKSS